MCFNIFNKYAIKSLHKLIFKPLAKKDTQIIEVFVDINKYKCMLVRNELVINFVDGVFWPPEGFRRGLTLIAGKHESTAANATSGQLS